MAKKILKNKLFQQNSGGEVTITNEQWNWMLSDMLNNTVTTLSAKGDQYSDNGDRLLNFKIGRHILEMADMGDTQAQACYAYMVKHLAKLSKMLAGVESYTIEEIREVCGDIRNYCYLMEANFIADERVIDAEDYLEKISFPDLKPKN